MLGAVGGNSYLYSNSTPSVKRELGSKESLSDLLIQEGEALLTPSPPRAPTPTHETVTFEYDSDGDINGRSANPSGVLSTEEDEKNAFGVIEYGLNNGEIRNTGRHDQHGWIIWQMVEHPEVYFTEGGPDTKKDTLATDSGTGHSLCSSFIHAHVHAGTGHYPHQMSYFGYGSTPEASIEGDSGSSASSIKGSSQNSGSDIENDTIPSSRSESPSELPSLPSAPPLPDIAGLSISNEITPISLDDNVSKHPHLQIAWSLGDIEPTGEHDEQGFPIWQVRGDNQRRFTEGNGCEPVGMSFPPHVYHEPGMLHRSM